MQSCALKHNILFDERYRSDIEKNYHSGSSKADIYTMKFFWIGFSLLLFSGSLSVFLITRIVNIYHSISSFIIYHFSCGIFISFATIQLYQSVSFLGANSILLMSLSFSCTVLLDMLMKVDSSFQYSLLRNTIDEEESELELSGSNRKEPDPIPNPNHESDNSTEMHKKSFSNTAKLYATLVLLIFSWQDFVSSAVLSATEHRSYHAFLRMSLMKIAYAITITSILTFMGAPENHFLIHTVTFSAASPLGVALSMTLPLAPQSLASWSTHWVSSSGAGILFYIAAADVIPRCFSPDSSALLRESHNMQATTFKTLRIGAFILGNAVVFLPYFLLIEK